VPFFDTGMGGHGLAAGTSQYAGISSASVA
jgi:hypothetical protein